MWLQRLPEPASIHRVQRDTLDTRDTAREAAVCRQGTCMRVALQPPPEDTGCAEGEGVTRAMEAGWSAGSSCGLRHLGARRGWQGR